MRSLVFLVMACLCLAGCASGQAVSALQIGQPSKETTGSVTPSNIGGGMTIEEIIATGSTMSALTAPSHHETGALEQVAMIRPPEPPSRPQQIERGKIYSQRFRDAEPVNFGEVTPEHYLVHGVDVSRWQGEIDWAKLRRQGANFAFIKATEGGDHLDPMFRRNWEAAHRAGLKRGAYHFFYWCRTAADQAAWFIRNVPRVEGALPPVLDVEFNHQSDCKRRWSREDVLEKMQVFMDRLERHYGQRPIVYTSPDFYRTYLEGAFPNHPFWLRSVAAHPSEIYPERNWVFWQYSGSGLSHGVDGRIDLNVFYADKAEWWRWVGQVTG